MSCLARHGCHLFPVLLLSASVTASAQDVALGALLDQYVTEGTLVAAQAVVGRHEQISLNHTVGVTRPGGDRRVNTDTLFCIGSVSKPFAAAILMTLVEDQPDALERPIERVLPQFGQLKLRDGEPSPRAPNLKELLSHRSGIYSQRRDGGMTARQRKWIRDFGLTLEEAVDGIAAEPLDTLPGAEYHYSGAGYCVLGRVAEVMAKQSFEELLQQRLCAPLKLTRTTYFPGRDDKNVAAGGSARVANPATPHLTQPVLRLPLIGGSLYSTAAETARFLRMVAQRGRYGEVRVMKEDAWRTWTSRPYPKERYGYGWAHTSAKGVPRRLGHSGSLASSRSQVLVVPRTGDYAVVHYTIAGLTREQMVDVGRKLNSAILRSLALSKEVRPVR